jgi:hypothetical protein
MMNKIVVSRRICSAFSMHRSALRIVSGLFCAGCCHARACSKVLQAALLVDVGP